MSASLREEMELIEKHEEILGQRAALLRHMEGRREQLQLHRQQRVKEAEAARRRNSTLLQDLQKIEDSLRGRPLPPPTVLALETKYWASVEECVPAWELFLQGKGPHPTDGPGQPSSRAKQQLKPHKETTKKTTNDQGLPPRPRPRTAR